MIDGKRLYAAVALCASIVYLGALWNHFVYDDAVAMVSNPVAHSWSGLWKAFTHPYWPVELGAKPYRPLVTATFILDWHLHGAAWFHAVNVPWHVAASVAVAALARRWPARARPCLPDHCSRCTRCTSRPSRTSWSARS